MPEDVDIENENSIDKVQDLYNHLDRKSIYIDYLIKRIGFSDNEFTKNYFIELNKSIFKFKFIDILPLETLNIESDNEFYVINNKYYIIKNGVFVPNKFDVIDYLAKEYSIKKDRKVNYRKNANPNVISATDLSNFVFCPVSFSINKTFQTSKIEATYNGIYLHEQARLLNHYNKTDQDEFEYNHSNVINETYVGDHNKLFIEDIRNSTLVFTGHNVNDKTKYFIGNKGNYAGQPDYIFRNKDNDFFVVEEKYQLYNYDENSDSESFFNNHIIQLVSYLHAIPNYNFKYGYLVYWKYLNDFGNCRVISLHVKKIEKSENSQKYLVKEFNVLHNFIKSGSIEFDRKSLNYKKCANCVSNLYCGHKTGKFDKLTYPYSESYLKTYYVKFPDNLRKIYQEPERVEILNFDYSVDIEELDLSCKNLSAIPKNVKHLKNLKRLNLSKNQLIDISILQKLQKLEVLNLESNRSDSLTNAKILSLQNDLPHCKIIW